MFAWVAGILIGALAAACVCFVMRRGFMPAPAPDVEHDHLYQAMFTRHPAIRLLIDPESGRILDASEAAAAFYGYTLATLKSKTIFDLNQRSESEVRSIMEETLSHDRATFELQHKLASGEIRDVKIDSGRISHEGRPVLLSVVHDISPLREAERVSRTSEQRMRTVLETMPVMMAAFSERGRVVAWNRESERVTGYSAAEMIENPRSLALLYPDPEYRREIIAGWDARRVYRDWETEITCKDGTRRQLVWSSIFLENPIQGWAACGIGHDVTEKLQAEAALRQSEEQYRGILESIEDGFYETDLAGNMRFFNPALCRILGRNSEELLGLNYREYYDPEHAARVYETYNRVFRTGQPTQVFDWRIRRKDGGMRNIEASISLVRSDQNRLAGFRGMVRDITARKQVENQLLRLATAVEQAHEAIFITDTSPAIVYVNPAFERITGYSRREVLGANPSILRSGKHDVAFYQCMWETLTRGDVWHGHFVNKRKDDTLYEEEATISPVRDETGAVAFFVAVKRDVTGEMSLERQLRQAQKMEAIGTLAGGIAHDFNNLLSAIMGFTEIAMEEAGDNGVRTSLEHVLQAGTRAKELVRQILTFSRQHGQERRPLQIHLIVKEALNLLRASLPATINIRANIDAKSGIVMTDPTEIHQILMNLCTNAYQAMRLNGGVLTVSLEPITVDEGFTASTSNLPAGQYICLTVADTGEGMDEVTKSRIFEPFFTTRMRGEGTGLGLATVHGIVTSQSGAILLDSAPGEGSTFRVYLPRVERAAEIVVVKDIPAVQGTERVLLVDDQEEIVRLSERILGRLGYHVTSSADSKTALDIFKNAPHSFDVVVTDYTMPGLTGAQLAKEMLAIRPDLPIVIMTGFSESFGPEDAYAMGIREYIMKPVLASELSRAIQSAIQPVS